MLARWNSMVRGLTFSQRAASLLEARARFVRGDPLARVRAGKGPRQHEQSLAKVFDLPLGLLECPGSAAGSTSQRNTLIF
jgi:hypothetical protein